jgi:hypothetical protein
MKTLLVLLLAALASATIFQYKANILISNDPFVWGDVAGVVSYYYDDVTPANSKRRIDFSPAVGSPIEIILYKDQIRYLKCSTCTAETYKNAPERWYPLAADVTTGQRTKDGKCEKYTRANDGDISYVWKSIAEPTRLCAIEYNTGKLINITSYSTPALDFSVAGWGCPAKVCNIVMDLVLVCDESGSIDNSEWDSLAGFVNNLIDSFTVSSAAVNIGIAFFTTESRIVTYLNNSATNVKNAFSSKDPLKGWTCIGCGIRSAMQIFDNPVPGRAAMYPKKVMVLLTDGGNNRPVDPDNWTKPPAYCDYDLEQASKAIKAAPYSVTSFAIAVGNEVKPTQLLQVASDASKVINVTGFDKLNGIIQALITATCDEFPPEPCGPSCRGFCSCDRVCLCPTCPAIDACTLNNCTQGAQWSGCVQTDKYCVDGNACTLDNCDPILGCQHPAVVCEDNNLCTQNLCDQKSGCYYPVIPCVDTNACTDDICTAAGGCTHPSTNCDDSNPCTSDGCDPANGCSHAPNDMCNDNNACTNDYCNAVTGACTHTNVTCVASDECHVSVCHVVVGCRDLVKNCDDSDICTADSCDNAMGCVYRNISCSACKKLNLTCNSPPGGDLCLIGHCVDNSTDGTSAFCQYVDKRQIPAYQCNSGNACIIDSCNPLTGLCSSTPRTTPHVSCVINICNPSTGFFDSSPVNCTSPDPCNPITCLNDECVQSSFCQEQNCTTTSCSVVDGAAVCAHDRISCFAGSYCFDDSCNDTDGKCYHTPKDCNDGKICTIDSCDPAVGCTHVNDTCDDGDVCTTDTCLSTSGCHHTFKCNDSLWCTEDMCTTAGVCINTPRSCSEVYHSYEAEKDCYQAYCTEAYHCKRRIIPGAFTNPCGGCTKRFATSSERNSKSCVGALKWPQFAGALAGGIIAAIVIGALIGAAILGTLASAATYKLYQLAQKGKDLAAHDNPTYKAGDHEGHSQLYQGK